MSIKPLFELDLNTDSFGLADCQELMTFYLYFDQSKTSRRDSVKNVFSGSTWSGHCPKFILSYVIILRQLCDTVNFSHVRAALTGTPLLST